MGTLANLSLPQYDWKSMMAESALPTWLAGKLVAGQADDDIILEAIMLTATVCNLDSAPNIADAGLVRASSSAKLKSVAETPLQNGHESICLHGCPCDAFKT